MAATDPISALFAQATAAPQAYGASSQLSTPSASSVSAFQSAMDAPMALSSELFGNSAIENYPTSKVAAPLLDIPQNIDYLAGTTRVLDKILPSLPNQLPSPMDLLGAQLRISAIQLEWQFIAKATGTAVQGVQSLVNSQV